MLAAIIENETFTNHNWKLEEYEECQFLNCRFESILFGSSRFLNCEFLNCDLSLSKWELSSLQTVKFESCKLNGADFYGCDTFLLSLIFERCQLQYAGFSGVRMPKTQFIHCDLLESDFTQADLSLSVFDTCTMERAIFEATVLRDCDLRSSSSFRINPMSNQVRGMYVSALNVEGVLHDMGVRIG